LLHIFANTTYFSNPHQFFRNSSAAVDIHLFHFISFHFVSLE
jgi:hypothetical protein